MENIKIIVQIIMYLILIIIITPVVIGGFILVVCVLAVYIGVVLLLCLGSFFILFNLCFGTSIYIDEWLFSLSFFN